MIDFWGASGIYLIWGDYSADYRGGKVWLAGAEPGQALLAPLDVPRASCPCSSMSRMAMLRLPLSLPHCAALRKASCKMRNAGEHHARTRSPRRRGLRDRRLPRHLGLADFPPRLPRTQNDVPRQTAGLDVETCG